MSRPSRPQGAHCVIKSISRLSTKATPSGSVGDVIGVDRDICDVARTTCCAGLGFTAELHQSLITSAQSTRYLHGRRNQESGTIKISNARDRHADD